MEQQNSMQPQMNMQGQENGQYVPGYDTQTLILNLMTAA